MKKRTLVPVLVAAIALLGSVGAAAHSLAGGPRPADVTVRVLPSSPDVYVVRRIVYTVLVTNVGGVDTSSVTVGADVGGDADASAFEVTQGRGTCDIPEPTHVACAIDVLPHGKTVKIRIRVRPQLEGTIHFGATTSAAANADVGNDSASVDTPVHPGKPGSPKLNNEDGPNGATAHAIENVAIVQGRIGVSEPGEVHVQVVDKTTDETLPLLKGSSVESPPLDTAPPAGTPAEGGKKKVLESTDTSLDAPVGDTHVPETAHPVYALQLPLSDVKPDHTYAVVVHATDLEGQPANLELKFKLKKK
jgi:Domain of unknown function DUF11